MRRNQMWLVVFSSFLLFFLTACGAVDYSSDNTGISMTSDDRATEEVAVTEDSGDGLSLDLGEKIIENANLFYETTQFENSIEFVNEQVDAHGGIVEHSVREQSGTSYQYVDDYISMSIRIPNEQLHPFIETVNNYATLYVQSQEIGQTDVTKSYRDNETRITVLREEEETLREMLQEQGTLEEILQIRTRLSEIIMEREIFEAENQNYDDQIEFSTVQLSIQQTDRASTQDVSGFWDRFTNAFSDSFYSFVGVMQQLMINLVYFFPYLLILIVIGGIGYFIWKKFRQ